MRRWICVGIEFHPIEATGFVGKAPCADEVHGAVKDGIDGPEEEGEVLGGELGDREAGELMVIEAIVVGGRVAAGPLVASVLEGPRGWRS